MTRKKSAARMFVGYLGMSWLILLAGGVKVRAQEVDPKNEDRAKAIRFDHQHRPFDALPLLEKVHKADPTDREIKERLACVLSAVATTYPQDQQVASLLRARKMFIELQKEMPLSNLGEILFSMIPEDGKFPPSATKKEAEAKMKEGELAFAKREYEKARSYYEAALAIDPKLYKAAVFAGDSYFADGKMDEAIDWFARASKIEPNMAVAYRYWGDALMKQKKYKEARDKFFEGIVAEPYTRAPWVSLSQWGDENAVKPVHPAILPPLNPDEKKEPNIEDGSLLVVLYQTSRTVWKEITFKERFPKEAEYRHSLEEERESLHLVAEMVRESLKNGKIKEVSPMLATLVKLEDEGLLEPYIVFARADKGIAEDYKPYREKNREKLIEYLSKYVAPLPDNLK
jgi:tetratricopeptide (TPR) repeat protein